MQETTPTLAAPEEHGARAGTTYTAKAYAARSANSGLAPASIHGGPRGLRMCRSKSCLAASVIPICTRSTMTGMR